MRGDPIFEWNKQDLTFLLSGPLRVDNQNVKWEELNQQNMEINDGSSQALTQQVIIKDWTVPFSVFNMAAGSLITIKGGPIKFESDRPLECMTLYYDKDPAATFNYFSCKTCGTNCKKYTL